MYKVCFADDEILDFQLLERLVDWNAMGFEIAGTATDGLEALALVDSVNPDLLFLDIHMPIMDGLECMKRIRERNQSVIIVIISAYEEFSYAKTAIQYGVTDYIIKPVGRAQLNETVKKIRLLLDEKKTVLARSRQKELELTYFELQKELTPVNCRQLSDSSYHSFFASITDAFCIRSYLPDGTRPAYPLLQELRDSVETLLHSIGLIPVCITEKSGALLFLFFFFLRRVHAFACYRRFFSSLFERFPALCLDIFILPPPIPNGYGLPDFLTDFLYAENPGFYAAGSGLYAGRTQWTSQLPDTLEESRKTPPVLSMIDALLRNNAKEEDITAFFDPYIERAAQNKLAPDLLKSKLFDMLVTIKLKLQNTRSEDAFYLLRNISPEELSRIEKVSFLKHRLHEIMKELFWTWTKIIRANSKENKVIYAANFYAEEHFHEEDFSVKKAASYVGMSGNYFISLYKEVTGQGFWDYVTGLRIRRATELLVTTDDTIGNIARAIGYKNEYHFSRKFKEITGNSPSQYRKSRE